MSEYYPAGVTDAHPHFNPPRESATAVECGADEALVVPIHAVKVELERLRIQASEFARVAKDSKDEDRFVALGMMIGQATESLRQIQQEREYECPFKDELDLEESECARWDCPVCGNERETDNLPEDRDPDEERYDYDD